MSPAKRSAISRATLGPPYGSTEDQTRWARVRVFGHVGRTLRSWRPPPESHARCGPWSCAPRLRPRTATCRETGRSDRAAWDRAIGGILTLKGSATHEVAFGPTAGPPNHHAAASPVRHREPVGGSWDDNPGAAGVVAAPTRIRRGGIAWQNRPDSAPTNITGRPPSTTATLPATTRRRHGIGRRATIALRSRRQDRRSSMKPRPRSTRPTPPPHTRPGCSRCAGSDPPRQAFERGGAQGPPLGRRAAFRPRGMPPKTTGVVSPRPPPWPRADDDRSVGRADPRRRPTRTPPARAGRAPRGSGVDWHCAALLPWAYTLTLRLHLQGAVVRWRHDSRSRPS